MRVQKTHKAFAYRVPIGDYNYLQCTNAPFEIHWLGKFYYVQKLEHVGLNGNKLN